MILVSGQKARVLPLAAECIESVIPAHSSSRSLHFPTWERNLGSPLHLGLNIFPANLYFSQNELLLDFPEQLPPYRSRWDVISGQWDSTTELMQG